MCYNSQGERPLECNTCIAIYNIIMHLIQITGRPSVELEPRKPHVLCGSSFVSREVNDELNIRLLHWLVHELIGSEIGYIA